MDDDTRIIQVTPECDSVRLPVAFPEFTSVGNYLRQVKKQPDFPFVQLFFLTGSSIIACDPDNRIRVESKDVEGEYLFSIYIDDQLKWKVIFRRLPAKPKRGEPS